MPGRCEFSRCDLEASRREFGPARSWTVTVEKGPTVRAGHFDPHRRSFPGGPFPGVVQLAVEMKSSRDIIFSHVRSRIPVTQTCYDCPGLAGFPRAPVAVTRFVAVDNSRSYSGSSGLLRRGFINDADG